MSALADLKELVERRTVVGHFVGAELKSGHRDKALGNLWQLIDPLALMAVYYVVWSLVLGRRPPDFMAYILSGIITFRMFQGSVIGSASVLRSQVRLIREVYFPKSSLPLAMTLARLYDFLWAVVAKELWMLYLFSITVGLGQGTVVAALPLLTVQLYGLRSYGLIMGTTFLGATLGGFIGPIFGGYIFDKTDSYQIAFMTCAVTSA